MIFLGMINAELSLLSCLYHIFLYINRHIPISQSLKKQMTKLAVHSVGSRVVELLFATFPNKSTAPLKLELYGPQYALFASAVQPPKEEDDDDNKSKTKKK